MNVYFLAAAFKYLLPVWPPSSPLVSVRSAGFVCRTSSRVSLKNMSEVTSIRSESKHLQMTNSALLLFLLTYRIYPRRGIKAEESKWV